MLGSDCLNLGLFELRSIWILVGKAQIIDFYDKIGLEIVCRCLMEDFGIG